MNTPKVRLRGVMRKKDNKRFKKKSNCSKKNPKGIKKQIIIIPIAVNTSIFFMFFLCNNIP